MALRPSKKTREKRVSARYKTTSSVAPIEQAKKDVSLVRALSEIVGEPSSAKAKLAKIETLIAVPIVGASSKRGQTSDSPGTDDNSIRGQWDKLDRVFKHIPDKSRNSVAASISVRQNNAVDIDSVADDILDIERGLDSLLANYGVKSKIRGELARAFSRLAERIRRGQNVGATLEGLDRLLEENAAEPDDVPPLPDKAKFLWRKDRRPGENSVNFIRRCYGTWLNKTLTRADIRRLDFPLYQSISQFLAAHDVEEFDLPTNKTVNDRLIENLGRKGSLESPTDIYRVASAVQRRNKRLTHS